MDNATEITQDGGQQPNHMPESTSPFFGLIPKGRIRLSGEYRRAEEHLVSSGPHFPISITWCEFTRVGGRGGLKYCRLYLLLGRFYPLVDLV